MNDTPRLIEHAFPLEQASLDSVHEKNVRHGHISTLHIWPARRPLAACRAALLATLLPDPGDEKKRQELCEKIGGKVVEGVDPKTGRVKRETRGGVLHWHGQKEWDSIEQQKTDLEWLREEIRKVYGRAPKVLDPFSGGGAIPLEAMRLGCEATAVDINPVAWFILKCTLEYPQKLAGQKKRLPDFVLRDRDFMTDYFKAIPGKEGKNKYRTPKQLEDRVRQHFGEAIAKRGKAKEEQAHFNDDHPDWSEEGHGHTEELDADLAWHVRAWGSWVLAEARKELAPYYPTYADWEPLKDGHKAYEKQPMRLVPLKDYGTLDMEALNGNLGDDYLDDETNPRWIAKPTVAYLWARTVRCKDCGATIPLLKTRWLCKKEKKRVLLTMDTLGRGKGVRFGIDENVPSRGGNAGQKREHDKKIGAGTMSRSGVKCPCCDTISTSEDVRIQGREGILGTTLLAVVAETPKAKNYRLPTEHEFDVAEISRSDVERTFENIPHGILYEATPKGGGQRASRAFSIWGYGVTNWSKAYINRQLNTLGTLLSKVRTVKEASTICKYDDEWTSGIVTSLAAALDRTADRSSMQCHWDLSRITVASTFVRFALPINWDFCECNPIHTAAGSFINQVDWIAMVFEGTASSISKTTPPPVCENRSALVNTSKKYDLILTDPPYYDAIPYSDLMDFYYVWLKRSIGDFNSEFNQAFSNELGPKWDREKNDGELIDDDTRQDGDTKKSKQVYEDGMARSFSQALDCLEDGGRFVVVFANKNPDAWETLVSALVRAGFVVDGSWPIQTEMGNRSRAHGSAALASSVWLVCKKRSASARAGWDNTVLDEMRSRISEKLRNFWDAGIRGPDFVWAATGPALEAYSKHPVVKKADEPGKLMTVSDFLVHARRMVVEFVVGQVLSGKDSATTDL